MKKILISVFLILFLVSCATSNVMSFRTTEGLRLFIKPITLNGEYDVKADMNIPCDDFKISGDVVVNYSIFFPAGSEPNLKSAVLTFEVKGETFNVFNPVMMFIESASGKKQEARFTSVLDAEKMKALCENADYISASLIINSAFSLAAASISVALKLVEITFSTY